MQRNDQALCLHTALKQAAPRVTSSEFTTPQLVQSVAPEVSCAVPPHGSLVVETTKTPGNVVVVPSMENPDMLRNMEAKDVPKVQLSAWESLTQQLPVVAASVGNGEGKFFKSQRDIWAVVYSKDCVPNGCPITGQLCMAVAHRGTSGWVWFKRGSAICVPYGRSNQQRRALLVEAITNCNGAHDTTHKVDVLASYLDGAPLIHTLRISDIAVDNVNGAPVSDEDVAHGKDAFEAYCTTSETFRSLTPVKQRRTPRTLAQSPGTRDPNQGPPSTHRGGSSGASGSRRNKLSHVEMEKSKKSRKKRSRSPSSSGSHMQSRLQHTPETSAATTPSVVVPLPVSPTVIAPVPFVTQAVLLEMEGDKAWIWELEQDLSRVKAERDKLRIMLVGLGHTV